MARLDADDSTPVAIGSSVPPWPDPAGAGQPAHPGDDVVRGHPAGLSTTMSPSVTGAPTRLLTGLPDGTTGTVATARHRRSAGAGLAHRTGPAAGAHPQQHADQPDHHEQRQPGPHPAQAELERVRQPDQPAGSRRAPRPA